MAHDSGSSRSAWAAWALGLTVAALIAGFILGLDLLQLGLPGAGGAGAIAGLAPPEPTSLILLTALLGMMVAVGRGRRRF